MPIPSGQKEPTGLSMRVGHERCIFNNTGTSRGSMSLKRSSSNSSNTSLHSVASSTTSSHTHAEKQRSSSVAQAARSGRPARAASSPKDHRLSRRLVILMLLIFTVRFILGLIKYILDFALLVSLACAGAAFYHSTYGSKNKTLATVVDRMEAVINAAFNIVDREPLNSGVMKHIIK